MLSLVSKYFVVEGGEASFGKARVEVLWEF